jgi:Holliday junction DNA helicase RuvA
MKDSLQHLFTDLPQTSVPIVLPREQEEAIKALESLGYKTQEAVKAVKKIDDGQKTCEQLIRQALQLLSG